jgi:rod shape-determining protein MreC
MLGTLDRTPPPFFRQGYSALSKLVFFSALSLFCMVADGRFQVVVPVRAVATTLAPVQRMLLMPSNALGTVSDYAQGLRSAVEGENAARRDLAALSERAAAAATLAAENARLRELLALAPGLQVRSMGAQVLYEAADPFSRKVILNIGGAQGVRLGAPVITEKGLIGQVTRVYPLSSEVTLVTDRDAAVPVLNARTQQRGAAFGGLNKGTALELRFVLSSADLRQGDALQTSGLDGVYPPGLAVATVTQVERQGDGGFARVLLAPAAQLDGLRHVLVLEPTGAQMPPRPDLAASAPVARPASSVGPAAAASAASAAAATTPAARPAP